MKRMIKPVLLTLVSLFLLSGCHKQEANEIPSVSNQTKIEADSDQSLAQAIETWLSIGEKQWQQEKSIPALLSFYAERQLGISYVGGLLDEPEQEQLVITLDGADCVIFVEMTLALTKTTLEGASSYNAFRDNLRIMRYREGVIEGYPSRLHYFSDWLLTNQDKGLITLLFQVEGLPLVDAPDFMSKNRDIYRHLADNDFLLDQIKKMEETLLDNQLFYIPTEKIPEFEMQFQTGDIIAFVTTMEGLDITHTGLVKQTEMRTGFYHASMTGSVIIDPQTIYEYASTRRNIKGIVIARIQHNMD